MALLRELHPDWSVEELKALVMNDATARRHRRSPAPRRRGTARAGSAPAASIPRSSAVGDVIALNADDVGLVSVTFEPRGDRHVTQTKKIRVVNKGLTDQTYDLAFDNVVDSPGVAFSLPGGSSVTVPAGQTVELDVQMRANAVADGPHPRPLAAADPEHPGQHGAQPRNFLTEEGATSPSARAPT